MKKLGKFFVVLFALALMFSGVCFADDTLTTAQEEYLNSLGCPSTISSDYCSQLGTIINGFLGYYTGDLTFRTNLLATGRKGGASTMSSSSTYIGAGGLAYTVIKKRVGGGGGLDSTGIGSSLPNGTVGQVISIVITALQPSGSWIVTPVNGTFQNITFDTVGDNAELLYTAELGWVVKNQTGCTVNYAQLA